MDIDRNLLAQVAQANPRLAGTVLRIHNELLEGELPDPPLLREFGEHPRDFGTFIAAVARTWEDNALVVEGTVDPS